MEHDCLCAYALPERDRDPHDHCSCALLARVRADERERHHSGECDECAPYHEPLPTGMALAIVAGRQDERRLVRKEIAQAVAQLLIDDCCLALDDNGEWTVADNLDPLSLIEVLPRTELDAALDRIAREAQP